MNPCDDWHPGSGGRSKIHPQKLTQYGIEKNVSICGDVFSLNFGSGGVCFFRKVLYTLTSWWLNQPIWKILVKLEIFPNFRGENKEYLKTPPSWVQPPPPFRMPVTNRLKDPGSNWNRSQHSVGIRESFTSQKPGPNRSWITRTYP